MLLCLISPTSESAMSKTLLSAPRLSGPGEEGGVKVKKLYGAIGRYDIVAVSEAPNDEVITRALLSLASLCNVRTLRASQPRRWTRF